MRAEASSAMAAVMFAALTPAAASETVCYASETVCYNVSSSSGIRVVGCIPPKPMGGFLCPFYASKATASNHRVRSAWLRALLVLCVNKFKLF
jgi:hypothetical protein